MENYEVIKALGQGTWGVVKLAKQKGTGRLVALKTIKSERPEEGINFTAVREIKLLREFKHENVIELVDVFTTRDMAVCLVYEVSFCDNFRFCFFTRTCREGAMMIHRHRMQVRRWQAKVGQGRRRNYQGPSLSTFMSLVARGLPS